MAFDRQNLTRMGSANSGSKALWLYSSDDDNYAAISAANYFDDAVDELKLDDSVIINDSGSVHTITYVDSNDGTTLTIATGNTITA